MSLRIARIPLSEFEATSNDVAQLRTPVFRDFPCLYDSDMNSECDYIAKYQDNENAILIGAWDGDKLTFAATSTTLEDHAKEFTAPFQGTAYDLADMFYCAESVLLPPYLGQGPGHVFCDDEEGHARAWPPLLLLLLSRLPVATTASRISSQ